MQLQAAAIFATIMALTQAMPTSSTAFTKRDDDCQGTSFTGATSGASPLVSDCQQMIANIAGNGNWEVTNWSQSTIVSYGTCAFGAQATDDYFLNQVVFGNQDVIDLVTDSINQFQSNGLVGASGTVTCGNSNANWGLYHT